MPFLYIENLDEKIPFNPEMSILNNLLISKVKIETYCGGKGNCGKCRIKLLDNSKYITPVNNTEKNRLKHFINEGWRLACQTYSLRDLKIYIPAFGTDEGIVKKDEEI